MGALECRLGQYLVQPNENEWIEKKEMNERKNQKEHHLNVQSTFYILGGSILSPSPNNERLFRYTK